MHTPSLRPLPGRFPFRAGWVSSFFLAVLTGLPTAQGQSLRQRLEASEAQDRANEIVRQMRELKNRQQSPSSNSPRYERSAAPVDEGPSESKLKADKVNGIMNLARAASTRGDLREALRLAREAQPMAQDSKFKADLKNWIAALEAGIAREEAWKAADALRKEGNAAFERNDPAGALALFKRALATDPNSLTEDGKKWVQELETRLKAVNATQQTVDAFAQTLRPASSSGELDFASGSTAVVDARKVPSGLPKSVEEMIPATPAGDRVRKGFQAIADHDWVVAKAWFEDALNREPGDPGLQNLVDLAKFTLEKKREKTPPAPMSQAEIDAVKAMTDELFDQWGHDELAKALSEYAEKHPQVKADPAPAPSAPPPTEQELRIERAMALLPPPSPPPKLTWKAFSDALFKPLPKGKNPAVSAVRG